MLSYSPGWARIWLLFGWILINSVSVDAQGSTTVRVGCPDGWLEEATMADKCYKLIASPKKNFYDASRACFDVTDGYGSLLSMGQQPSAQEHGAIINFIKTTKLARSEWFTGGIIYKRSTLPRQFRWIGSGNIFDDPGTSFWLDTRHQAGSATLEDKQPNVIAYVSNRQTGAEQLWGWSFVSADDEKSYICELPLAFSRYVEYPRTHLYGIDFTEDRFIPRGPRFTRQPINAYAVEDSNYNYVSLECVADAYPFPTYTWWKGGKSGFQQIQMSETRYMLINGKMILFNPSMESVDFAKYYCTAENGYGVIRSNTISIKNAKLGVFQIDDRTAIRAREKMFQAIECKPPSHSPANPIIQWYKDERLNFINTETQRHMFPSYDGNLYVQSVEKADVGRYFCSVRLNVPEATVHRESPAIHLEVIAGSGAQTTLMIWQGFPKAYALRDFESDATQILRGHTVRLECMAQGAGILTYFWSREYNKALPSKAYFEKGNWNRVLMIPDVQPQDAGKYLCSVKDSRQNNVQQSYPLIVRSLPYFLIDLRDRFVDENAPEFIWRCEANGDPQVRYEWYKNNKIFNGSYVLNYRGGPKTVTEDGRIKFSRLGNVITFNNVHQIDSGMYQCGAINALAARFSNAQLRVVSFKPSFDKYPLSPNMLATIDSQLTIPCRPEGAPEPQIEWHFDGVKMNVPTTPGVGMQLLPDNSLFLTKIGGQRKGEYKCVAKNSHGTAESKGVLSVLGDISLFHGPQPVLATVGDSIRFSCSAKANLRLDLQYLWKHNGRTINFERESVRFKRGSGIGKAGDIMIPSATFEEAGLYTCMPITPAGIGVGSDANLTLVGPPGEPSGVVYTPGHAITIQSLALQWFDPPINGAPIQGYVIQKFNNFDRNWMDHIRVNLANTTPLSNGRRRLIFGDLNHYITYNFRVAAFNRYGDGAFSAESKPERMPAAVPLRTPRNLTHTPTGGRLGLLQAQWDHMPMREWAGPNFRYKIQYRRQGETAWQTSVDLYPRNICNSRGTCIFSQLVKNHVFEAFDVRVAAVNDVSTGTYSNSTVIMSAEGKLEYMVRDVYAEPYNSTSIVVYWSRVPDRKDLLNGKLQGFRINYWRTDNETAKMEKRQTVMGDVTHGLIIGLSPNTRYTVNVMCFTGAMNGPKSTDYKQMTLRRAPQNMPTEVHLYPHGGDSIEVKFRGVQIDFTEEPLQGYRIRFWRVGESMLQARIVDARMTTNKVVNGLEQNRKYYLRVFGYSRGGEGKMSSPALTFVIGPGCLAYKDSPEVEYRYLCNTLDAYFVWQGASTAASSVVTVFVCCVAAILGLFR